MSDFGVLMLWAAILDINGATRKENTKNAATVSRSSRSSCSCCKRLVYPRRVCWSCWCSGCSLQLWRGPFPLLLSKDATVAPDEPLKMWFKHQNSGKHATKLKRLRCKKTAVEQLKKRKLQLMQVVRLEGSLRCVPDAAAPDVLQNCFCKEAQLSSRTNT